MKTKNLASIIIFITIAVFLIGLLAEMALGVFLTKTALGVVDTITSSRTVNCRVVENNDGIITVEDNTGNLWDFYSYDVYAIGSIVEVVFDNNGTPDDITDDIILTVWNKGA